MAIIIKTADPAGLLTAIKKAIDAKSIETWLYNSDGFFTHSPEQWKYKAWFKPETTARELKFGIYPPKDDTIKSLIYGLYHGRFIEMMLNHFDKDFSEITATALIVHPDYQKK